MVGPHLDSDSNAFPPPGTRAFYVCDVPIIGSETLLLGPYATLDEAKASLPRVKQWLSKRYAPSGECLASTELGIFAYTDTGLLPGGELNTAMGLEPRTRSEGLLRGIKSISEAVGYSARRKPVYDITATGLIVEVGREILPGQAIIDKKPR